jgi:hypothetical protein
MKTVLHVNSSQRINFEVFTFLTKRGRFLRIVKEVQISGPTMSVPLVVWRHPRSSFLIIFINHSLPTKVSLVIKILFQPSYYPFKVQVISFGLWYVTCNYDGCIQNFPGAYSRWERGLQHGPLSFSFMAHRHLHKTVNFYSVHLAQITLELLSISRSFNGTGLLMVHKKRRD